MTDEWVIERRFVIGGNGLVSEKGERNGQKRNKSVKLLGTLVEEGRGRVDPLSRSVPYDTPV